MHIEHIYITLPPAPSVAPRQNNKNAFRKNVFFDKLEKDLNTTTNEDNKYDGVIYLLNTIREKLNNLTPNRKDLKNYINDFSIFKTNSNVQKEYN